MSQIPDPREFFLNVPLYKAFEISDEDVARFLNVECYEGTLDSRCIECESDSVFICVSANNPIDLFPAGTNAEYVRVSVNDLSKTKAYSFPTANCENVLMPKQHVKRPHDFKTVFVCSRNNNHRMTFYFSSSGKTIQKIGQYPSIADLHLPDLIKYRKLLGNADYKELVKGVGLNSHGIGIGACIYLRRIFEKLIVEAKNEAAEVESGFDDEQYLKSRMSEKIVLLKDYLPDFLVENRNIYGVLSKAIHELTEEECLVMFPALLNGIELILDDKLAKKEKEIKEAETKKIIADLSNAINGDTADK